MAAAVVRYSIAFLIAVLCFGWVDEIMEAWRGGQHGWAVAIFLAGVIAYEIPMRLL